jgi:hypothetical protein
MGHQLPGVIALALLLTLAAYVARRTRLSPGWRVVLSGLALAADLRDYLSE